MPSAITDRPPPTKPPRASADTGAPSVDRVLEEKRRLSDAVNADLELRATEVAEHLDRARETKPLKAARSQAELTRVRQGYVLIFLAITNLVLIWLTRA